MENKFSTQILQKVRPLAIYQIAGGIVGLGLSVWAISKLTSVPTLLILVLIVATVFYGHSIYCGILLLKKNISGLGHSLINQCLQLVSFSIPGFGFKYVSGINVSIGADLTNSFELIASMGLSSWEITINTYSDLFIISFNIVAFFIIIFIEKLRMKNRKSQLETKIDSIGQ